MSDMNSWGASQIDMEQHLQSQAYERLSRHPEVQAEAIASHYRNYSAHAATLVKLVQMRRERVHAGMPNEEIDKAIEHFTNDLRRGHLQDLGIPLVWHERSPLG